MADALGSRVLEVNRSAIGETRLVTDQLGELADRSVRFEIERFSITANTTTYAEFGDMLDYWSFWPSGDAVFGRVPAMGWAKVIESTHPDVEVGGRYYGWFPMAQYVDVVVSTTKTGLRDDSPNRAAHAAVYRAFDRTDHDALHPSAAGVPLDAIADAEDRHALLRGLFVTGYLADGFFRAKNYFGASYSVVLSASSKTAIGYAAAASDGSGVHLVGVTSPGNVDAVTALGLYDSVVTYDDAATAVPDDGGGVVIVDMAGNGPVVVALHDALGDRIGHSMTIGRTHHDAPPAAPTSGPAPELFFAPTAMDALRDSDLDADEFAAAMPAAVARFIEGSHDWLTVDRRNGPDAAADTWAEVLSGAVPPTVGRIVSLHP